MAICDMCRRPDENAWRIDFAKFNENGMVVYLCEGCRAMIFDYIANYGNATHPENK